MKKIGLTLFLLVVCIGLHAQAKSGKSVTSVPFKNYCVAFHNPIQFFAFYHVFCQCRIPPTGSTSLLHQRQRRPKRLRRPAERHKAGHSLRNFVKLSALHRSPPGILRVRACRPETGSLSLCRTQFLRQRRHANRSLLR